MSIWKRGQLVDEFRGLEAAEQTAQVFVGNTPTARINAELVCLPITARVWSNSFPLGGRRSIRAARTARTVGGIWISPNAS
jgi:hypothetical protein